MTFGGENGSGKTSKEAAMPSTRGCLPRCAQWQTESKRGLGGCKNAIKVESLKLGIYLDEEVLRGEKRG